MGVECAELGLVRVENLRLVLDRLGVRVIGNCGEWADKIFYYYAVHCPQCLGKE